MARFNERLIQAVYEKHKSEVATTIALKEAWEFVTSYLDTIYEALEDVATYTNHVSLVEENEGGKKILTIDGIDLSVSLLSGPSIVVSSKGVELGTFYPSDNGWCVDEAGFKLDNRIDEFIQQAFSTLVDGDDK